MSGRATDFEAIREKYEKAIHDKTFRSTYEKNKRNEEIEKFLQAYDERQKKIKLCSNVQTLIIFS